VPFYKGVQDDVDASLISDAESGKIIRFVQDCDIPIYHYQCPKILNSDKYCYQATCKYCVLSLRGYLTTSDGRRDYAPLPAPPVAFKRWKCALHGEELCEKDCSVFSQQNSVYRVHEWNWERKKFEECIKDSWNPLEHGYYNPAQEKKEQEELGAVRRARRGERKTPYSRENQEARRSLRPKRNLQIGGKDVKLNCGSGRRKDWKAIGCGKPYCGDCTF